MTLDQGQFNLVYNAFSLAIAAMGAAFVYFLFARSTVLPRYRIAVSISAIVVLVALYHYVRIFDSWNAAFAYDAATGTWTSGVAGTLPFNEGYRYVDWLITVPLLLAELVLVLRLDASKTRSLLVRLGAAAVAMILLGYPGETAPAGQPFSFDARGIWGIASTVPFIYILWVLFGELGRSLERQPERVKQLVGALRLVLVATWGVYPIAYIIPSVVADPAMGEVLRQVGYSLADIAAKPLFGLLVLAIAVYKSRAAEEERVAGELPSLEGEAPPTRDLGRVPA